MFYVAEGEVELLLEQRRVMASPGTFMLVPQGTPHGFSNPGSQRSKLLILFCPADSREGYFEGLAELTRDSRQRTHEELVELMRKFDQHLVPGPSPA